MGPGVSFINPFGTAAHADLIRKTPGFDALDGTARIRSESLRGQGPLLATPVGTADTMRGAQGTHERFSALKNLEKLSSRSDRT